MRGSSHEEPGECRDGWLQDLETSPRRSLEHLTFGCGSATIRAHETAGVVALYDLSFQHYLKGVADMTRTMVTVLALCSLSISASALTLPSAQAPEHAYQSQDLSGWSVGFEYEAIKRSIDLDQSSADLLLEGDAYSLFLGYDLSRHATLFGTIGSSRAKLGEEAVSNDRGFKFSLGIASKLWNYDVLTPRFMAGRLSLRPMAEYAYYSSEETESADEADWYTIGVALPVGYTMFRETTDLRQVYQTGLDLWVGPAFNYLDGRAKYLGKSRDFSGTEEFGWVAGLDIYITEQLSIGGHAEIYEEVGGNASLRFIF